ncbi:DUF6460 domain-containing protein [Afifella aestuarii]|uniref:DUF6460 domain-containing protein n=1 Tax=Afifella aestuarii TaxID=1909496 RepID=UPI000FE34B60|nr:DUF6460 domain-containing protein [Afifella aestuarii]
MAGRMTRFLGDSPFRVLLRLIVLSVIVGLVLSVLNVHPFDIYYWAERFVMRVYHMGFTVFSDAFGYFLFGALIVVPIFLIMRLFSVMGGRRD